MRGVAVVVVNYRTKELTCDAVASVLSEPEVEEAVVVDNASGDGSAEYLGAALEDRRVRVLVSERNRGFGPAVNIAARTCQAPLLLLLNSDATLRSGSLAKLVDVLAGDDAVGIVAPAVYDAGGRSLQPGVYGRLPSRRDLLISKGWVHTRVDDPRMSAAPEWVSGVAMLLRRADFLALGGFDEAFTMYLEDVDLCRRLAAAGKTVRREPAAAVLHRGGQSWPSDHERRCRFHESKLRYFEKLGVSRFELHCLRLVGTVRSRLGRQGRQRS